MQVRIFVLCAEEEMGLEENEDTVGNRERSVAFMLSRLLKLIDPSFTWKYAEGVQFSLNSMVQSHRAMALLHEVLAGTVAPRSWLNMMGRLAEQIAKQASTISANHSVIVVFDQISRHYQVKTGKIVSLAKVDLKPTIVTNSSILVAIPAKDEKDSIPLDMDPLILRPHWDPPSSLHPSFFDPTILTRQYGFSKGIPANAPNIVMQEAFGIFSHVYSLMVAEETQNGVYTILPPPQKPGFSTVELQDGTFVESRQYPHCKMVYVGGGSKRKCTGGCGQSLKDDGDGKGNRDSNPTHFHVQAHVGSEFSRLGSQARIHGGGGSGAKYYWNWIARVKRVRPKRFCQFLQELCSILNDHIRVIGGSTLPLVA